MSNISDWDPCDFETILGETFLESCFVLLLVDAFHFNHGERRY